MLADLALLGCLASTLFIRRLVVDVGVAARDRVERGGVIVPGASRRRGRVRGRRRRSRPDELHCR